MSCRLSSRTFQLRSSDQPLDHQYVSLNDLGIVLAMRFGRTGLMEDVDGVITTLELAVQLNPEGHHYTLAQRLDNLAKALCDRF